MSLRGENVLVWIDGSILGGIIGAECSTVKKTEEIREFLTREPVAVLPGDTVHRIVLRMHAPDDNPGLAGFDPNTVELRYGTTREVYSDCVLSSLDKKVKPRGEVEYTAEITAGTRSVSNG